MYNEVMSSERCRGQITPGTGDVGYIHNALAPGSTRIATSCPITECPLSNTTQVVPESQKNRTIKGLVAQCVFVRAQQTLTS
jgi:hypothetical protein